MGNNIQKFIYNLSAVSPICFIFSIVWLIQKRTWNIPVIFIISGIFIIFIFFKSFNYGLKNLAPISITPSDISPNDGWIIIYIISYIVPIASIVVDEWNPIISGIIASMIAIIAPFINSAIPNPLLFIKKYHFYSVSGEHGISGYVLISKKKYRNKRELKTVKRMFDFLLLDVGGK